MSLSILYAVVGCAVGAVVGNEDGEVFVGL